MVLDAETNYKEKIEDKRLEKENNHNYDAYIIELFQDTQER